ncbi:hypothetical protein ACFLZV_02090 [Candidatus Margulisiibacteriota bacterium]
MTIFLHSVSKKENYILKLIDHYHYLTSYALPLIFKYKPNRYTYMKKLCEKGLLEFIKYPRYKLWYLSSLGKKYMATKRKGFKYSFNPKKLKDEDIKKNVAKTNLEIFLNKKYSQTNDIKNYVPDKYIFQDKESSKQQEKAPDSEFTYLGKYNVAFEVAVQKKKPTQYHENIAKYLDKHKYHRIYWLYDDPKEKEKLINSFKEVHEKNKGNPEFDKSAILNPHVCVNLQEMLKEGLDSQFTSLKETLLT